MKFTKLPIEGAYVIDLQKREDERGYLVRTWCAKEFADHGINASLLQGYATYTKHRGTIRGIHYQVAPFAEAKLTRVIKGAIFEAIVDLRPDSPTYLRWEGVALKASDGKMMYIPENVAHGFLTLSDDVEFHNMSSQPFTPEFECGIRYEDSAFNINWPIPVEHVSEKDRSWPDFAASNRGAATKPPLG